MAIMLIRVNPPIQVHALVADIAGKVPDRRISSPMVAKPAAQPQRILARLPTLAQLFER